MRNKYYKICGAIVLLVISMVFITGCDTGSGTTNDVINDINISGKILDAYENPLDNYDDITIKLSGDNEDSSVTNISDDGSWNANVNEKIDVIPVSDDYDFGPNSYQNISEDRADLIFIASDKDEEFGGGSGTQDDPYLITTEDHLENIRKNSDQHYKLRADIDLSSNVETSINTNEGFEPIGSDDDPYSGIFDGGGNKIKNLTINLPETDSVGLFGKIDSSSEIKNIVLENVKVIGNSDVGGLVGYNSGGNIINTSIDGMVTGHSGHIGGLVGRNDDGQVTESYSNVSVEGEVGVGGLVGWNGLNNGYVTESYSDGGVVGDDRVGGLVGWNLGRTENSYSKGDVNGVTRVGGLIGENQGDPWYGDYPGRVSESYAAGNVSGDSGVGGLIGANILGYTNQTYYDIDATNQEQSDGGNGRTTKQMIKGVPGDILDDEGNEDEEGDIMYQEWDEEIWDFNNSSDYPSLNWQD